MDNAKTYKNFMRYFIPFAGLGIALAGLVYLSTIHEPTELNMPDPHRNTEVYLGSLEDTGEIPLHFFYVMPFSDFSTIRNVITFFQHVLLLISLF